MTALSPPPKRRWFRWFAIGMAVIVAWAAYRSCELEQRVTRWKEGSYNKNIGLLATSDPLFPGLPIPGTNGNSRLQIPFLERRGFLVLVGDGDGDGVEDALSLSECPARLVIQTGSGVTESDRQRLRDRFGVDNVR